MKKYKTRQARVLVDICCDVCSVSCKNDPDDRISEVPEDRDFEYATLSATWGYFSRKDGESYHVELCERCFDNVVKHIQSIKTHRSESKDDEERNS